MNPEDRFITIQSKNPQTELTLHVREWRADSGSEVAPFVLVHGLSSNARTWDGVARRLVGAGHRVVAVDQRGHGLSDKPDDGYDFDTVTDDLALLIDALGLVRPIVVGQSWGGNVMLALGVRYPQLARGLGFVDGGTIDLQGRPDGEWAQIEERLRPPPLAGTLYELMYDRIRNAHQDWSDEGIVGTLANFEKLDDGTVRPWLTLDRHMMILRAMWEQRPAMLYASVPVPVLICPARTGQDLAQIALKEREVAAAHSGLPNATVHWFDQTDHDVHVHRPAKLAEVMLRHAREGIWAG